MKRILTCIKKYRQLIVGIIIGAMLFSLTPIQAAIEEFICYRADYKLVINGVEFNDPDLPLMSYKGYTVGSVRKILEAAGVTVTWNAELGQAEANAAVMQTANESEVKALNTSTVMEYDLATGLPLGAVYIEAEENNIKFKLVSYNGDVFISSKDLEGAYGINRGTLDIKNGIRSFFKGDEVIMVNLRSSDYFNANSYSYYRKSLFETIIEK